MKPSKQPRAWWKRGGLWERASASLLGAGLNRDLCWSDGEVNVRECADYRAAQYVAEQVEQDGGRVLAVCEGETNLTTGEATVWVRR